MSVVFRNNATSTLAEAIGATQTTLIVQVNEADEFPQPAAGQWFPLTLVDRAGNLEIVHCTVRANNVLNVERGCESTEARAFPVNTIASHRLTAESLQALIVQGVVISESPPPPPVLNGQIWWESDSGSLFIWYDDGDSAQWVQVGGGGGGSGGGAAVTVGDVPPGAPLHNGQLWFKSNTGNLYIWYEDVDSGQWVQINSAVAGGAGGPSSVPTVAIAASMTFLPSTLVIATQSYAASPVQGGARYARISKADIDAMVATLPYPALAYFRSVDRYLPDGTVDATNGGYWMLHENQPTPQMLGAKADWNGTSGTDDSAAINATFSYLLARFNGGTVRLIGRYYVATTVLVNARCTMIGDLGTSIGNHSTALVGAAALTPVVRMYGGGAAATTAIERFVITRAGLVNSVPVADGLVGLTIEVTDQCRVTDIYLRGHAYCVDVNANQTGFYFERVITTHCHRAHYLLRACALPSFTNCWMGRNGGLDVPCDAFVEIDNGNGANTIDTINFTRTQFNQTGGRVKALLYFKSYGLGTSNGIINFTACHAESFDPAGSVVIKADPAVTVIREIHFDSSTTIYTSLSDKNFFDVQPATVINLFTFNGHTTFNMNIPSNDSSDVRIGGYIGYSLTCANVRFLGLSGMYNLGSLTLGPATTMRVFGAGFYVNGASNLSGVLNGMLHGTFAGGLVNTATGGLDLIGSFVAGTIPTLGIKHSSEYMQLKDARPFKVWDITGTTDASGNATVAHGSGGSTNLRVRHVQAFYKNAAGAALPMTVNYIDGANVSISAAAAITRPFIVSMILSNATHSGW